MSVPAPDTHSTILVVEDDNIVRMLIVDVLEELEYKVLEADGCDQALEFLRNDAQPIALEPLQPKRQVGGRDNRVAAVIGIAPGVGRAAGHGRWRRDDRHQLSRFRRSVAFGRSERR